MDRMNLRAALADATMSHGRRWQLIRAIEDRAAGYHQHSWTRGSEARYIAEGNAKADSCEWEWIAWYIAENPEVLTEGPKTEAERAEAVAIRKAKAAEVSELAARAWKAGRFDEALSRADQGETFTPHDSLWGHARSGILAAKAEAEEAEAAAAA